MFCRNCGREMAAGDKFCPACGTSYTEQKKSKSSRWMVNGLLLLMGAALLVGMTLAFAKYYTPQEKKPEYALQQLSSAIYSGDYELAEQYVDFDSLAENFYSDYYEGRYEKDKADLERYSARAKDSLGVDSYLESEYKTEPERQRRKNLSIMQQVIKKAIKMNHAADKPPVEMPRDYSWLSGNTEEQNIQYLVYLSQQYEPKIKTMDVDGNKAAANIEFTAKKEDFNPQSVIVKLELKRNDSGNWKVMRIANMDELMQEYFTARSVMVRMCLDYDLRHW
ncbi:zinc-ribbon domain-containing protein [Selenomonas ruminantium]|uniref:Zinc-ribbon domain-containing protein n=1 Tax=Selenomonas ruminantium TaxID=971 RepID=A0A1M6SX62_SELRU|nr:zinc ribbon domain-containing protein [Selenomonas ruminantium]SHK49158.1 zinc-ribbon domain-containing protein [Selenomonas ruminantium]